MVEPTRNHTLNSLPTEILLAEFTFAQRNGRRKKSAGSVWSRADTDVGDNVIRRKGGAEERKAG